MQYHIELSENGKGYEVTQTPILPVFLEEYLLGYFFCEGDQRDSSDCQWNSLFEGTKERVDKSGIPIGGSFRMMVYMLHENKCLFITSGDSAYVLNEKGWFPLYETIADTDQKIKKLTYGEDRL